MVLPIIVNFAVFVAAFNPGHYSPGWDASPSQGYPQHYTRQYPFIHVGGERHCESKVTSQKLNTILMSQARARTQTARSRVKRTNHESSAPPSGNGAEYITTTDPVWMFQKGVPDRSDTLNPLPSLSEGTMRLH